MSKKTVLILLVLFTVGKTFAQTKNRLSIHATSNKVDIKDGEFLTKGNWTLSPQTKPDIYKTDVKIASKKKVTFYTDLDSISFDVENNKIYNFNIILNQKDTCWTQINTMPTFKFDKKYITKNKGKYSIEIPEVQELVHIIIALTPSGMSDENMVEHDGDYYKKVVDYFGKYKNEPIVKKIDDFLQKGGYSVLKMDACCYVFSNNKIVKEGIYEKLSWEGDNYAEPFIADIEKFAELTNFRKFYSDNKIYYNKLIEQMKQQNPIDKQWKWLENHSKLKYDNYWITFSPLVNGNHSTNKFVQDDFKQTVMFICGPIENTNYNDKIVEGLMTRVVFTEIDHNYVNPVSDIYRNEIDKSMVDINKWASQNALSNYRNQYLVFNEYMTWGVFTLYAMENFSKEDFDTINKITEDKITDGRGFLKFREFNKKIIELYKAKGKGATIESLYPEMLKWCSEQ